MEIKIAKFDAKTATVQVTFSYAGVTHVRAVNACLTQAGRYDSAATAERVDQVAAGVEHKIDAGVITNPA